MGKDRSVSGGVKEPCITPEGRNLLRRTLGFMGVWTFV